MPADTNFDGSYIGAPEELPEALSRPNVINVSTSERGTYVTFRVHGREGHRTYFYPKSTEEQLLDIGLDIAEDAI